MTSRPLGQYRVAHRLYASPASAAVMALPALAQALVGRVEILTLWPFSEGELEGRREGFVDSAFQSRRPQPRRRGERRRTLESRLLRGGFPEPATRASDADRMAWFAGYATTILQREVRDLANIDGLAALPRLLALVAARATTLLNTAELGRSAGIPNTLGADARRVAADRGLLGPLLENLVAMELVKQAAWSESRPAPYHFRSHAGEAVDVVLEDGAGRVVGVEVKAAATVDSKDLRGLRALAHGLGKKFVRGVVLYTGTDVVPFGERLHALPVAALWTLRAG